MYFDLLLAAVVVVICIRVISYLQAEILRIDQEEGRIMSFIEIKNLNKYYSVGKSSFQALKDIDLQIEKGDFSFCRGKIRRGKVHAAEYYRLH